jgi:predicted phage tail protein
MKCHTINACIIELSAELGMAAAKTGKRALARTIPKLRQTMQSSWCDRVGAALVDHKVKVKEENEGKVKEEVKEQVQPRKKRKVT